MQNPLLRRSTNLVSQFEGFERAWLAGDINDSTAESPDYTDSNSLRHLRNIQKSAPRLPDYELLY